VLVTPLPLRWHDSPAVELGVTLRVEEGEMGADTLAETLAESTADTDAEMLAETARVGEAESEADTLAETLAEIPAGLVAVSTPWLAAGLLRLVFK
jgi:hypothetical protein